MYVYAILKARQTLDSYNFCKSNRNKNVTLGDGKMFVVGWNKEPTSSIMKSLISNICEDKVKLQSIQNLKSILKPSEKTLKNIKLKSLLLEGGILLRSNFYKKSFLITYGTSLINYIGKDCNLDLELLNQLEYILTQFKEEDENLVDKLYKKICQLQNDSVLHFSGIVDKFKPNFEKILLNWIENNDNSEIEFLAQLSAKSPKLFQVVTSILYSIMVTTSGHWKIFEATAKFISLVMSLCTKNGKDFLGLYPDNCRRIVSLLIVSPEFYFDEIIKNEVLELLTEMFLLDKRKTLILLSHYSDWLCVFRNYFLQKNVNS